MEDTTEKTSSNETQSVQDFNNLSDISKIFELADAKNISENKIKMHLSDHINKLINVQ